ncbi:unnamed protein product, partial [Brenthis ino]
MNPSVAKGRQHGHGGDARAYHTRARCASTPARSCGLLTLTRPARAALGAGLTSPAADTPGHPQPQPPPHTRTLRPACAFRCASPPCPLKNPQPIVWRANEDVQGVKWGSEGKVAASELSPLPQKSLEFSHNNGVQVVKGKCRRPLQARAL